MIDIQLDDEREGRQSMLFACHDDKLPILVMVIIIITFTNMGSLLEPLDAWLRY